MSLGIKSLWRARSRCGHVAGLPLISRDLTPSRLLWPEPSSIANSRRCESTLKAAAEAETETEPEPVSSSAVTTQTSNATTTPSPTWSIDESKDEGTTQKKSPTGAATKLPNTKMGLNRNQMFKNAFKDAQIPEDSESKNSYKAFVHKAREYPTKAGTMASYKEHVRDTRRQVGQHTVWTTFSKRLATWSDCFGLMKKMTPKWDDQPNMSAVRIVLPQSWDIDIDNLNLQYVDSATGVLQKLRASVDQNPSAVVLRGKSSVLTAAADEIVRQCQQAKVYELGEVGSTDYRTKQLWPTIQGALNGGASMADDQADNDNFWVHKEYQPHWISKPYEDIPRPETWTRENFETYIASLTYGRIKPHLAIPFYGTRTPDGRKIDTEGIRIRLIMEAFEDAAARPFITVSTVKMAIALMAFKGGHAASANRLFRLAEGWGVPMDTDVYNMMLEGYTNKHDVGFFYRFLCRMDKRYYEPNIRTWLLFLRLTKGEDERRQVVVAMYELGMFKHATTRKGIAETMASHDAYSAFKAGKTLAWFLASQRERYGKAWCTVGAMNRILTELLRFHRPESARVDDCKRLIAMQAQDGLKMELSTVNLLLRHAAATRSRSLARWAMALLKPWELQPDQATYAALITLCTNLRCPHGLGVVFFHGVLDRKLDHYCRRQLRRVLLRTHPNPFWRAHSPRLIPKALEADLRKHKIRGSGAVLARLEHLLLKQWAAYTPVDPLSRSLDLALRSQDAPLHRQLATGEEEAMQIPRIVHKLRERDGGGKDSVVLNGTFQPELMIEGWRAAVQDAAVPGEEAAGDHVQGRLSLLADHLDDHVDEDHVIEDPIQEALEAFDEISHLTELDQQLGMPEKL